MGKYILSSLQSCPVYELKTTVHPECQCLQQSGKLKIFWHVFHLMVMKHAGDHLNITRTQGLFGVFLSMRHILELNPRSGQFKITHSSEYLKGCLLLVLGPN